MIEAPRRRPSCVCVYIRDIRTVPSTTTGQGEKKGEKKNKHWRRNGFADRRHARAATLHIPRPRPRAERSLVSSATSRSRARPKPIDRSIRCGARGGRRLREARFPSSGLPEGEGDTDRETEEARRLRCCGRCCGRAVR